MSEYFVGLMSGTSMDGVDAVVVDFSASPPVLSAAEIMPIPPSIREKIVALSTPGDGEIERLGSLDVELGRLFADAVAAVVERAGLAAEDIRAIGSHGQTIRHEPTAAIPFTLQIGDPNVIAQQTGIATVADFRRRDMAVGGQGAPLAPAYHHWFLGAKRGVVVNVGGMANVTIISSVGDVSVRGFDTGPGNVLMDSWAERSLGERMDRDGDFARQGRISNQLLEAMFEEPFFSQLPPKSTGRERFNKQWLETYSSEIESLPPEDVAATLCELTARTIAASLQGQDVEERSLWVCGGGVHNSFLLQRLRANLAGWVVNSAEVVGMDPDWVEAMAFAWLARQTLRGESGNLPSVTGGAQSVILGAIFPVKSNRS